MIVEDACPRCHLGLPTRCGASSLRCCLIARSLIPPIRWDVTAAGSVIESSSTLQVLRFGCSYEGIADSTCSATTIRTRRAEWIDAGVFARLKQIALDAYDRMVGLALDDVAVDGCITKAPGGGQVAGPSPVDRRKQGMKRSLLVEGHGIPLGRVLAGANRHDSPLLEPTLDLLEELGPLPEVITVHLDSGYDSGKTRDLLDQRGLQSEIAHKGHKVPIQAGHRWHIEHSPPRKQ